MTNLIAWTEEMSVGVAILDEDHRRIMKMINMLYLAMQEGKGKQIMTEIIHDLFAYINLHFETEEEMFDQTGYEGGPEQKAEHHKMKTKSLEMMTCSPFMYQRQVESWGSIKPAVLSGKRLTARPPRVWRRQPLAA